MLTVILENISLNTHCHRTMLDSDRLILMCGTLIFMLCLGQFCLVTDTFIPVLTHSSSSFVYMIYHCWSAFCLMFPVKHWLRPSRLILILASVLYVTFISSRFYVLSQVFIFSGLFWQEEKEPDLEKCVEWDHESCVFL